MKDFLPGEKDCSVWETEGGPNKKVIRGFWPWGSKKIQQRYPSGEVSDCGAERGVYLKRTNKISLT